MKGSGKNLKDLRIDAGYTQAELAERIGISRETVVAIENEHPKTINSLQFRVVEKWWAVCRSAAAEKTRLDFRGLIAKFFRL